MTTQIPKLRFPEFVDEWEKKLLGELTVWASGGTPSKENETYWNGDIPWISASSMRGKEYYNSDLKITIEGLKNGSKLAKKGSLLILVRGSMLFNKIPIGIAKKDVAFNQDVKSIVVNESAGAEYILLWFEYSESKIMNMVSGTGIGAGKLDLADLKALDISLPSLPEQIKITNFLNAIDTKIQQLTKKKALLEEYKKGVMQQLFSQKIRFKDDDGEDYTDWEEKRLRDICKRMATKNKVGNTNVLTISAQKGLVSQLEFFNKSVAGKDLTGYYLLSKNDFAYNKSYSNGYPMGAIKRLKYYEKGVVSTLYICFTFFDTVDILFMEQYFESGIHNVEIEKVAQEGARNHGLLNIGLDDFFNISIVIPSLSEQTKIANFLTSIDTKIETVAKQIEQTQAYKKGLLQQLFI